MPATLFHGTRAGFDVGGILLPAHQTGRAVNHEHLGYRSDWVYGTSDVELAWYYAEASKGRGKPKVLVVVPYGKCEVDNSTVGGEEQDAYRFEWGKVVKVIREKS